MSYWIHEYKCNKCGTGLNVTGGVIGTTNMGPSTITCPKDDCGNTGYENFTNITMMNLKCIDPVFACGTYPYPVTPCPSGGYFCAGSFFKEMSEAEHQSEKMKEAYVQGEQLRESNIENMRRLHAKEIAVLEEEILNLKQRVDKADQLIVRQLEIHAAESQRLLQELQEAKNTIREIKNENND